MDGRSGCEWVGRCSRMDDLSSGPIRWDHVERTINGRIYYTFDVSVVVD